jgi:hypothetical protein
MIKKTVEVSLFMALIAVFQIFHLPQLVTGIFVNSVLVFILLRHGMYYGSAACILSPALGIFTGFLSPALYFTIPVIILGNLCMIILYKYIRIKYLRYIIPAIFKALFIFSGAFVFINIIKLKVPARFLLFSFSFVQIITAIGGIILAEIIFKQTDRR